MSVEQLAADAEKLLKGMRELANSDVNIEWHGKLDEQVKILIGNNKPLKDWSADAKEALAV